MPPPEKLFGGGILQLYRHINLLKIDYSGFKEFFWTFLVAKP